MYNDFKNFEKKMTASTGTLYIVATPIGNLSDITAYAIDCLKVSIYRLWRNTRTSGKLLNHFNITTKTCCNLPRP